MGRIKPRMKVPRYPENMKKAYDPDHELSYGYFGCSTCGSTFFSGGDAIHHEGCVTPSYSDAITWHFGPNERAREWVEEQVE